MMQREHSTERQSAGTAALLTRKLCQARRSLRVLDQGQQFLVFARSGDRIGGFCLLSKTRHRFIWKLLASPMEWPPASAKDLLQESESVRLESAAAMAELIEAAGPRVQPQVIRPTAGEFAAVVGERPRRRWSDLCRFVRTGGQLTILLGLTEQCNFGCVYCYAASRRSTVTAAQVAGKGGRWLVVAAAIDAALHAARALGGDTTLNLVFFGGEPTLGGSVRPLLVGATEYANEQAFRVGVFLRLHVVTNGSGIDDEAVGLFKTNGVEVTVSMDLPRRLHDRLRPFAGGQPSSEAVVRGITNTVSAGVPVGLRVTLTSLHQGSIVAALSEAIGLGATSASFEVATPTSCTVSGSSDGSCLGRELVRAYTSLLSAVAPLGPPIRVEPISSVLSALKQGQCVQACEAGTRYFSVSSDGVVYPCQRLHDGIHKVGDISHWLRCFVEGGGETRGSDGTREVLGPDAPQTERRICEDCVYDVFCSSSGCVAYRDSHASGPRPSTYGASPCRSPRPHCDFIRAIVDEVVWQSALADLGSQAPGGLAAGVRGWTNGSPTTVTD